MTRAADVKNLAQELRPHIEAALDSAEILKGLAAVAREKGIDWTALKALVKAQAQDARDGTDKRVAAIIEKADFAASYADMLGFASQMNNKGKGCSSSADHIVDATDMIAVAPQKPAHSIPPDPPPPTKTASALQASVALARAGADPFDYPDIPAYLDRRPHP